MEVFVEWATSEQRPEVIGSVSSENTRGNSILDRGKSQCKSRVMGRTSVFEVQKGGQCGWNREREGRV